MFCNVCGTELQPTFNLCPRCGKPVGTMANPGSPVALSRLQKHLPTLGILWIAVGVLFLLPSLAILFVGSAAHFVIDDNVVGRTLGPVVMSALGGSLLLVAVGGILVGWGLRNLEPWARTIAVVLGIVALFHPPFGTALGIYTLWVLLADGGGAEYRQLAGTTQRTR
jgi:hypothetical protein